VEYYVVGWAEHYEPGMTHGGVAGPLKWYKAKCNGHHKTTKYSRLLDRAGPVFMPACMGVFGKCCELVGSSPRELRRDGLVRNDDHEAASAEDLHFESGFDLDVVRKSLECLHLAGWIQCVSRELASTREDAPLELEGEGELEGESEKTNTSVSPTEAAGQTDGHVVKASRAKPIKAEDLERIFQAYPVKRRGGRKPSYAKIQIAIRDIRKDREGDAEAWLLEQVETYASVVEHSNQSFVPLLKTWMGDARYENPACWPIKDRSGGRDLTASERLAQIRRQDQEVSDA